MSGYDKLARVRDIISILRDLDTIDLRKDEHDEAKRFATTYLRAELNLEQIKEEENKPEEIDDLEIDKKRFAR